MRVARARCVALRCCAALRCAAALLRCVRCAAALLRCVRCVRCVQDAADGLLLLPPGCGSAARLSRCLAYAVPPGAPLPDSPVMRHTRLARACMRACTRAAPDAPGRSILSRARRTSATAASTTA
jgi:hypothetical protein